MVEQQFPEGVPVPTGMPLHGPDLVKDAQFLMAVGALTRAAASADLILRMLYCAMIGSPYAAVTAAGQSTSWLVDSCSVLAEHRRDVDDLAAARLKEMLQALRAASKQRNRLVHALWVVADDGPLLASSRRGSPELRSTPATLDEVMQTREQFTHLTSRIHSWADQVLGSVAMSTEAQLRWAAYMDEQTGSTDA